MCDNRFYICGLDIFYRINDKYPFKNGHYNFISFNYKFCKVLINNREKELSMYDIAKDKDNKNLLNDMLFESVANTLNEIIILDSPSYFKLSDKYSYISLNNNIDISLINIDTDMNKDVFETDKIISKQTLLKLSKNRIFLYIDVTIPPESLKLRHNYTLLPTTDITKDNECCYRIIRSENGINNVFIKNTSKCYPKDYKN